MSLRWRVMFLTPLMLLMLLAGCATNPVSKKPEFVMMSEKQELELGQRAAAQVAKQMPLLPEDDPLVQYVNEVGQKVAAVSDRPELYYRFHVVDDKTINAFALPGGYIYIYRGLLVHLNSEAELAAVLGHEIGHVTARHAVERYTQAQAYRLGMAVASIFVPIPQAIGQISDLIAMATIQGFGRKDELQADELSIRYITRAGYDPHATIRILQTLKRLEDIRIKETKDETGKAPEIYHGAFASHPATEKRIREAVAEAAASEEKSGFRGRERFLAKLDGQPYGDSAREGAVVGRRFLHPKMHVQLAFPKEWVIHNGHAALTARRRRERVYFRLTMNKLQKRQSAEDVLRDMFSKRRLERLERLRRGPFELAQAEVNVSMRDVGQARALVAVARRRDEAWMLLCVSQRARFDQWRGECRAILDSFRAYDPAREGDIPRIHLHVWKRGDSWRKLAAASHDMLGRFTADRLAALNGMDVNETPKPGRIVKTVE